MRSSPRLLIAGLALCFSQVITAAGESYMSLVGQLYAGVELPRFAKDFCSKMQPSTKADVAERYDSWSARNASFLARARRQFSRADDRLKSEGASLSQMDPLVRQQLDSLDSKMLCGSYATLLQAKEKQFTSELKQLLEVVEYADAELSKR